MDNLRLNNTKYVTLDDAKRVLEAQEKAKHTVLKLPCCGTAIEIFKKQDMWVLCPNKKCGKKNIVTFGLAPHIRMEQR